MVDSAHVVQWPTRQQLPARVADEAAGGGEGGGSRWGPVRRQLGWPARLQQG